MYGPEDTPFTNLRAPLNPGGNIPTISHWFVCYHAGTAPTPTGDVTLDKVTTGGTAPAAGTQFTFTVVCDSGTETSPVDIAPNQAPVLVADNVEQGDSCTITETGAQGATGIAFEVTGGTGAETTANSVTFTVGGSSVSVLANNTFPEPTPTGDVTLDKVTTGGTAPAGTTTFTFTVACQSGTVSSPVSVAPNQAPVLVADDVAQGNTCTITETVANGASAIAFQVTGARSARAPPTRSPSR